MLETDIKELKDQLSLKLSNAEMQELHWEAKAYSDCLAMLNAVLKDNRL